MQINGYVSEMTEDRYIARIMETNRIIHIITVNVNVNVNLYSTSSPKITPLMRSLKHCKWHGAFLTSPV